MNEIVKRENINEIDVKATEYLNMLGFAYTPEEGKKFLEICKAFQLNPFKREIYGIKGWDSDKGTNILTIIVGYEVYLKRAERTGLLDGYEKEANFDKEGNLVSATVIIYRKDWTHPFKHIVYLSEFARRKKDGSLMKMWATMPAFMLLKVCLAQAFRLCFPDEMGGLPYIKEEIELNVEAVEISTAKPIVEMPKELKMPKKNIEKYETQIAEAKDKGDMPKEKEKKTEKEVLKTYEELSNIITNCLNLAELENEWKANLKSIKGLAIDELSNLNEQKNIKKEGFKSILSGE
jgi:phage recombination protein Bet